MSPQKSTKSALHVQEGIEQPPQTNDQAIKQLISRKGIAPIPAELVTGIREANRMMLSRAITLIESAKDDHQKQAQEVIAACLPFSGNSIRVGITGVPGVGKSTFIEALGSMLTAIGHKVAVLAIDPSSQRSKGSILGDKTRMEKLSVNPDAFIRPSPSAGTLGGVSQKTRESIVLCEAAGFDIILVETVGVGQSETVAKSMVDFFLLLQLAGAGDELQGIKRGIMEMADAIFINKADGDNKTKAMAATVEYKNALHLFPPSESGWTPVVGVCSSHTNEGIEEVWQTVKSFIGLVRANGYFYENRRQQDVARMHSAIEEQLLQDFYGDKKLQIELKKMADEVGNSAISPYVAAQNILRQYLKKH